MPCNHPIKRLPKNFRPSGDRVRWIPCSPALPRHVFVVDFAIVPRALPSEILECKSPTDNTRGSAIIDDTPQARIVATGRRRLIAQQWFPRARPRGDAP